MIWTVARTVALREEELSLKDGLLQFYQRLKK